MKITLEIPADIIANMMISAMESGDPVTTAARGGWCRAINFKSPRLLKKLTETWWYADPKLYDMPKFMIEIIEVDDESTGHETSHMIGPAAIARGLTVMAKKFPDQFGQIMSDNTDAPCADIFLQCILFGEEKYA